MEVEVEVEVACCIWSKEEAEKVEEAEGVEAVAADGLVPDLCCMAIESRSRSRHKR